MLKYVSHKMSYAWRIEYLTHREPHRAAGEEEQTQKDITPEGTLAMVMGSSGVRDKDGDNLLSVCSQTITGNPY